MHPIVSEQLARSRGEDLLEQASAARRVAGARTRGTRPSPRSARVRSAVGRRLVAVGTRLAGPAGAAPGAPARTGIPCP